MLQTPEKSPAQSDAQDSTAHPKLNGADAWQPSDSVQAAPANLLLSTDYPGATRLLRDIGQASPKDTRFSPADLLGINHDEKSPPAQRWQGVPGSHNQQLLNDSVANDALQRDKVTSPEKDKFGNPEQEIRAARDELHQQAVKPDDLLTSLMAKNRVVGLGEGHEPGDPLRLHAKEIIDSLKKGGANILAVEIQDTPENRAALDKFTKTGDAGDLPAWARTDSEYMAVLNAARDNGMKIVGVDMPHPETDAGSNDPRRDQYMAQSILDLLKNPDNKVAFWVGAMHLDDLASTAPNRIPRTAGEVLRENVSIATVAPMDSDSQWSPLSQFANDFSEPMAIGTHGAPNLGALKDSLSWRADTYDYYIFYPDKPQ